MQSASSWIPQFSLRLLFAVTLVIALIAAMGASLKQAFYRTPHQQAIDNVLSTMYGDSMAAPWKIRMDTLPWSCVEMEFELMTAFVLISQFARKSRS